VSLPWPPQVLPQTPPLAPKVAGPLPISPRFFRRVSNRERVVVGLDEDGTPNAIRVQQTLVMKRLGDYVFAIAAPVRTVLPGPGTESPPGQRTNQILWQGSGAQRLVDVQVAAPLLVSGTVGSGAVVKEFKAVLDGIHRNELRLLVPGRSTPKISMRVRTVGVRDRVQPTQTVREQLANTIDLELTYARKRQYDQFLSAADATGHSSTTYIYRTTPRPVTAAPLESSGSSGNTMGWIALAVLLAAALPVAAVVWARS